MTSPAIVKLFLEHFLQNLTFHYKLGYNQKNIQEIVVIS